MIDLSNTPLLMFSDNEFNAFDTWFKQELMSQVLNNKIRIIWTDR